MPLVDKDNIEIREQLNRQFQHVEVHAWMKDLKEAALLYRTFQKRIFLKQQEDQQRKQDHAD